MRSSFSLFHLLSLGWNFSLQEMRLAAMASGAWMISCAVCMSLQKKALMVW